MHQVLGHKMKAEYKFCVGTKNGRREHREIIEKATGRKLGYNEIVHHKNGNKLDNRLDNLCIMSRSEHSRQHTKEQWENDKGDMKINSRNSVRLATTASEKPCVQIRLDGTPVKVYRSLTDTKRFGFCPQKVCSCCKGHTIKHRGFLWKYIEMWCNG